MLDLRSGNTVSISFQTKKKKEGGREKKKTSSHHSQIYNVFLGDIQGS